MRAREREIARVRNALLLLSGAAWALLLAGPGPLAHCEMVRPGAARFGVAFHMMAAMNPPATLAASWALMLVAMMAPTLLPAIDSVRARSFRRRRARSTALFVLGYGAVWMAACGPILAMAFALRAIAPQSYGPAAVVCAAAFVWQCSPLKQRCLNRCHAHPALAAFGPAADFDALRFGVAHGVWCAGSCWLSMLVPVLLPAGHFAAMVAVTVLIFSERLEHPSPPAWRIRGLGKAGRYVAGMARTPAL